eukprot:1293680-Amorphochlora_amoeboformis.AAC.1
MYATKSFRSPSTSGGSGSVNRKPYQRPQGQGSKSKRHRGYGAFDVEEDGLGLGLGSGGLGLGWDFGGRSQESREEHGRQPRYGKSSKSGLGNSRRSRQRVRALRSIVGGLGGPDALGGAGVGFQKARRLRNRVGPAGFEEDVYDADTEEPQQNAPTNANILCQ